MRRLLPLLALLIGCNPPGSSPCTAVIGPHVADTWGGDARVSLQATGWFRTQETCGRWWYVDPDGHPFYSAGVNHVDAVGDTGRDGTTPYAATVDADYPDRDAWADATAERLKSWGFTTAGAWSDYGLMGSRMPYTVILSLAGTDRGNGSFSDWFDPAWVTSTEATVADRTAAYRDDPALLGWFLDNEIHWGPDWRNTGTLLQSYLGLPADAPGKQAAVQVLLDGVGSLDAVNTLLGTSFATKDDLLAYRGPYRALDYDAPDPQPALTTTFLQEAAERYFSVTTTAIRAVDPNHLVLGNREIATLTRSEVWDAAAAHVDVLTANDYVLLDAVRQLALGLSGGLDPSDAFAKLHALHDMPVMTTEFGFRAADSGLPNSWPPVYPTLDTQQDRAQGFHDYVAGLQAAPWVVGYHWFEWVDEPAAGRFDGEDDNWGLVDVDDQPYTAVTDETTALNPLIWMHLRRP